MTITVNGIDYQANTSLGMVKKLETFYKMPLTQLLAAVSEYTVEQLLSLLSRIVEAGSPDFKSALEDQWGYMKLQVTVQKALAEMAFAGTPNEVNEQLEAAIPDENAKNHLRRLLGLQV